MAEIVHRARTLTTCCVMGIVACCWHPGFKAAGRRDLRTAAEAADKRGSSVSVAWDRKAAAAYLDQRESWWMEWPRAARDHGTFCVSCHTAVPYALSRPALREQQAPTENERRLLDNVKKRVRLWKEVAPFYSDADRGPNKTVESRGTESVLNALILVSSEARDRELSQDANAALSHMWAEQQVNGTRSGAWLWLRFANEPWEADDSDFYGAALAAITVGTAPGNYRARPEIQQNLNLLRAYLNRESGSQPVFNRVVLLWASSNLPGLLAPEQQKAIMDEVLATQAADGGWSLSSVAGTWKRHDGTPQEGKSDGYATGLVTLALQQAGISRENAQYKRGIAWLSSNQNKTEGCWPGYSLNNNEGHHIGPETAHFMNDAATAYAVLALESERH